ncbi:MAG TPA: glycosyltransferase 87 family protein [Solirubrobacteraceae bacterium]|nr:glycosyltransferase 87 family protein [Solirubrobacteraceae bacterium]
MATPEIARAVPARWLPAARVVREAAAATTLAGIVAGVFLFASAAASGPYSFVYHGKLGPSGLPGWVNGPLDGLSPGLTATRLIVLSSALFGLYLVAVALADAMRFGWVVAAILALHAILLVGPPTWLTDAFNYLGFARLGALHGLDPYGHTPSAVPTDAAFPYVSWPHLTSPYGPLFTAGSYVLVPLGVSGGLWALKAAVVAASLGSLAVVWKIAEALERPVVPALVLVGLNPLFLLYGVGGFHNDPFMLLLVLAGILWAVRGVGSRAGAAIVAAAAVKVTGGLALPFMWAGSRDRRGVVLGAAVAGVGVIALSAILFGADLGAALTPFSDQGNATSLRSFPGMISSVFLGRGVVSPTVQVLAQVAFAVVVLGLVVHTWRGGDWIVNAGWATLALLLALPWVMPWYVAWLLPFAALGGNRRLRVAALTLTAFLVVVRMPYPPV